MSFAPVGSPVRGSVIYLHGVGGAQPRWRRPVAGALDDHAVDLIAPTYDDLLTTAGSIHARRDPVAVSDVHDAARGAYLARQRRLRDLITRVGEATHRAWPVSLPHPGEIADRLPLHSVLRSPFFGLDQMGRYLDDAARRAAVLHRVRSALLRAPRPRVVIGHSLGSVVAMDLLADPDIDVDLLITLGSPLAHPAVDVQLHGFPYRRLGAWLNVVHLVDPVPAGRGLSAIFPGVCDAFISPLPGQEGSPHVLSRLVTAVTRAATSHLESTYLESPTVIAAMRDALRAPARPHLAPAEAVA
jgi:hypothetical protein